MEKLTQAAELIKEAVETINRGKEEPRYNTYFGLWLFFKFYSISSLIKRGLELYHSVAYPRTISGLLMGTVSLTQYL